ncbi:MAG: hypothetical protein JO157_17320 [Acetobacteraceae bacterium]|nr:hypothetical protein [Acetobacteraceae bacterium]
MRTLILAGLLAAGSAFAQAPPVRADAAWARATAPGQAVGAACATLNSPMPDRLVGVQTPITPVPGCTR